MKRMTRPLPARGTRPGAWLPTLIECTDAHHQRWYMASAHATWPDLVCARATAAADLARAVQRGWGRAQAQHGSRLARYDAVLEVFAPLMAAHPSLTFAAACARLTPQALQVVKEL